MRKLLPLLMLAPALAACGGSRTPNELAISRQAPLVVPPDFNLRPPRPGDPRPQEIDAQSQAIDALFGPGVQLPPRTPGEQALLNAAGANRVTARIRATVADNGTQVTDKGAFLKQVLDAPAGDTDPAVASLRPGQ